MTDVSDLSISNDHSHTPLPQIGYENAKRPRYVSNVKARDVTEEFTRASEALKTGQLVKDEFFTLFESVGALEAMDPKMDSGYLAPGETLDDDYEVLRQLLPEEVIGIMDHLLCYEMAWHDGYPLSQTLFTSVYIDKLLWPEPRTLSEAQFFRGDLPGQSQSHPLLHTCLRAYCVGLIRCCNNVLKRILSEHFYEEEDFATHTYNRNMLSNSSDEDIRDILRNAMAWLSSDADPKHNIPSELRHALHHRLSMREMLVRATSTEVDISSLPGLWEPLLPLLSLMQQTHNLGKLVPEAFSAKIQRRLASTVPPRPIVELEWDEAFAKFKRLCEDVYEATKLTLLKKPLDFSNILAFIWTFSSRKPNPTPYARAVLQSILFNEKAFAGRISAQELLLQELERLVLPGDILVALDNFSIEVPNHPRHQIAQKMQDFLNRALPSYLDLLRSLCQNRCRMRRTLCHVILDFENLQLDAENFDIDLRAFTKEQPIRDPKFGSEPIYSFPLSSWAYHHKLMQMEWIIQLGFEHDIYRPDELAGMYWYLIQVCHTRIEHLERIRGFVTRKYTRVSRTQTKSRPAFELSLAYNSFLMLEANATQSFACALACLYTALQKLQVLPNPPRPYGSPALRYELRMKPFLTITLPGLLPFPEFEREVQQPEKSAMEMLEIGDESIKVARKDLGGVKKAAAEHEVGWDIDGTLRACITTGVAIASLRRALQTHREKDIGKHVLLEIPDPGKRYHDWWVVPKITVS